MGVVKTSPCLELFGGPICGRQGECVFDAAFNTSSCMCSNGWEQSAEMAQYYITNDQVQTIGMCNRNSKIDVSLYSAVLFLSVLCLFLQVIKIKRRSQVRRLAAFLISLALAIATSIYKLSRLSTALIGDDIFFTVLIAASVLFTLLTAVFYYDRYLNYMVRSIHSPSAMKRGNMVRRSLPFFIVFDSIAMILIPLSAAIARKYMFPGRVLFKLGMAISLVQSVILFLVTETVYKFTMRDMAKLRRFYTENPVYSVRQWPDAIKSLDKSMAALRLMRILHWILDIHWFLIALLMVCSDFAIYTNLSWAAPLFVIVYLFVNLFVVVPRRRIVHKQQNLAMKEKKNSATKLTTSITIEE